MAAIDVSQDKYALHAACREGRVSVAESLLKVSTFTTVKVPTRERDEDVRLTNLSFSKTEPRQASREDDDGRLPIHWAASSNSKDIVVLLAQQKGFDPDVQVRFDVGVSRT